MLTGVSIREIVTLLKRNELIIMNNQIFTVSKFTDYLESHWSEFSLQSDCITFKSDRVRIDFCLALCKESLTISGQRFNLSRVNTIAIQNCVAKLNNKASK